MLVISLLLTWGKQQLLPSPELRICRPWWSYMNRHWYSYLRVILLGVLGSYSTFPGWGVHWNSGNISRGTLHIISILGIISYYNDYFVFTAHRYLFPTSLVACGEAGETGEMCCSPPLPPLRELPPRRLTVIAGHLFPVLLPNAPQSSIKLPLPH